MRGCAVVARASDDGAGLVVVVAAAGRDQGHASTAGTTTATTSLPPVVTCRGTAGAFGARTARDVSFERRPSTRPSKGRRARPAARASSSIRLAAARPRAWPRSSRAGRRRPGRRQNVPMPSPDRAGSGVVAVPVLHRLVVRHHRERGQAGSTGGGRRRHTRADDAGHGAAACAAPPVGGEALPVAGGDAVDLVDVERQGAQRRHVAPTNRYSCTGTVPPWRPGPPARGGPRWPGLPAPPRPPPCCGSSSRATTAGGPTRRRSEHRRAAHAELAEQPAGGRQDLVGRVAHARGAPPGARPARPAGAAGLARAKAGPAARRRSPARAPRFPPVNTAGARLAAPRAEETDEFR